MFCSAIQHLGFFTTKDAKDTKFWKSRCGFFIFALFVSFVVTIKFRLVFGVIFRR
jgi:hypothetical protein